VVAAVAAELVMWYWDLHESLTSQRLPGSFWPILCVCGALVLFWALQLSRNGKTNTKSSGDNNSDVDSASLEKLMRSLGIPAEPHEEQFVLSDPPLERFFYNNDIIAEYQTDLVHGKYLMLHRATYDKDLDKSGEYPYGDYFVGKKRLWEGRVQLRFKKPVEVEDVFFGMTMKQYVPMKWATKMTVTAMVKALQKFVGKGIYQSNGDNPEEVKGKELERPQFIMPLWAFDQFIVTPEGEEPPDISVHDISTLGHVRKDRVKAYRREIADLKLVPGPTYTFCFWGIAQFLDCLKFRVVNFGPSFDLRDFSGPLPATLGIYVLKEKGAKKHYDSMKDYLLCVAVWSSAARPELAIVESMLSGEYARRLLGKTVSHTADRGMASLAPEAHTDKKGRFCCG